MESAGRVWRVRVSVLTTPVMALALLGLVLGTGEVAARSRFVRSRLAAPSVGSPSRLLDLQLADLNAQVEREGGVDCLFLGNSLVLFGLDPDAFDAAYEARTGKRLRSFNFAVSGTTVSGVAAMARILVEDYHPRLIIYGLTVRDFSGAAEAPAIEATPWVRYRWGAPTVDGWLVEHSLAYRYFLLYGWEGPPAAERDPRDSARGAARGFRPVAPATTFDATAFARAKSLVSAELQRGTSEQQRAALTTVLQVRDMGVQLVIIELPLHLDASQWPNEAVIPYQHVMEDVRQAARATGTPVWPSIAPQLLPEDGWFDLWHLNARGATVFSGWLAERVAAAEEDGELTLPHGGQTRPLS